MRIADEEGIDKLFKRLEDHVIEPDNSHMEEMRIKLEASRFYSFGWKHFNIYYSLIIGLSGILSLWVFTDRFLIRIADKSNIIVADTIYVRDTVVSISKIGKDESADNKNLGNFVARKNDKEVPKSTGIISTVKNQDSTKELPQGEAIEVKERDLGFTDENRTNRDSIKPSKTVLPKKVIYVTKRDTVVKYDTTKVIRKK